MSVCIWIHQPHIGLGVRKGFSDKQGQPFPWPMCLGESWFCTRSYSWLKDWKKEKPVISGERERNLLFWSICWGLPSGARLRTQCCTPVTSPDFILPEGHRKQVLFYPSLAHKDREVQRDWMTCPEPHGTEVARIDVKVGYQVWCSTSGREHSMGGLQWVQASTPHQIWQPIFYCYNKILNIQ